MGHSPENIELAQFICLLAHIKQEDKNGQPYWKHPYAVADMVQTKNEKIVAYLHDTIEDSTFINLEQMHTLNWFDQSIIEALDAITRKDNETYFEYIQRVKENQLARTVKIADLTHNMLPERSQGLTQSLRKRYAKALALLSE